MWIWMYGSWWDLSVVKGEYEWDLTVVKGEYECIGVGEIWQLLRVNMNVWELVRFDSCYMWIWMYGSWWDLTVVKGEYECIGVGEIWQLLGLHDAFAPKAIGEAYASLVSYMPH